MSRFGRLVLFLLVVLFFMLMAQWSYTGSDDARQIWEDTQEKVSEWWSPDDTHSHDEPLFSVASEIRDELKAAKIIGDVVDDFTPKLKLDVSWESGHAAKFGNTLKPVYLQEQPVLRLTVFPATDDDSHPADEPLPVKMDEEDEPDEFKEADIEFPKDLDEEDEPDDGVSDTAHDDDDGDDDGSPPENVAISDKRSTIIKRASFTKKEYVIIMTDPDAPAADDPNASEYCHWIGGDLHLQTDSATWSADTSPVMEYTPPAPPQGSGKHRYVFLVYMAKGGSDKDLSLTTPDERKSWGYSTKQRGVRQWAEDNQLVPVAANYIYAKNDKDF